MWITWLWLVNPLFESNPTPDTLIWFAYTVKSTNFNSFVNYTTPCADNAVQNRPLLSDWLIPYLRVKTGCSRNFRIALHIAWLWLANPLFESKPIPVMLVKFVYLIKFANFNILINCTAFGTDNAVKEYPPITLLWTRLSLLFCFIAISFET